MIMAETSVAQGEHVMGAVNIQYRQVVGSNKLMLLVGHRVQVESLLEELSGLSVNARDGCASSRSFIPHQPSE
jgi:hypothetical protein